MNASCGTCRHTAIDIDDDGPVYTCRRYPPQITGDSTEAGQAWPTVELTDWCGEHSLADDTQEQP